MEINLNYLNNCGRDESKPELEQVKSICRCCLSKDRRMKNIRLYEDHFRELTGLNVAESDGLPPWLCYECSALLLKATRFKLQVLRAHTMLYEYLSRCAPFPIDAQDPELDKYARPHLSATPTLAFDNAGRAKSGYHKLLQHVKQTAKSDLDSIEIPLTYCVNKEDEFVKEEIGFSDYEDNITLEEYRSNVTKITEEVPKITEDDLDRLLQDHIEEESKEQKIVQEDKAKKKKIREEKADTTKSEPKTSIRKPVELDSSKIRIIMLNPEEQVKQREEESKANLKFPYLCQLCFKGFNFEDKLQNHMKKHSPSRGTYECKLCRMYLPTAYSYSVHSLIHTQRYECVTCGRRMVDRASILDHYRKDHEGVLTLYTCHICGKVSSNNKTHRGHMRNHHFSERPKCDECGKTFVNKDSLAEHLQIHRGIKNYECDTCGKRFRTRTQIRAHQATHSDAKNFYCVECDVRFKTAHNLRQHLQKNLKHRDKQSLKFACARCEKRFPSEAALGAHVRVQHEGERAHRCAHCPAALASRNSLRKHVAAVHRGLRPPPRHVCHACGKPFRGKSALLNHVRTHTGEKPFECGECGRKFSQRTSMRTHVKLVHLKIRRTAKVKPEAPPEAREPKIDLYTKEEAPLVFDTWRQQQPCDVYFTVTAGP